MLFVAPSMVAQNHISISVNYKEEKHTLEIQQQITFTNASDSTLTEIHFFDWPNSYCSKTTPLAKRFAENYDSAFHFEKNDERGRTTIHSMATEENLPLEWRRGAAEDILILTLQEPLSPGESVRIKAMYSVQLPKDNLTRYGYAPDGSVKLKHWFLTPAVFDGTWQVYSNKGTDDIYLPPTTFDIVFKTKGNFELITELNTGVRDRMGPEQLWVLHGENRQNAVIHLEKQRTFESIVTDNFEIVTNLKDEKVSPTIKALTVDRISGFLTERLGAYPHEKMLISEAEYRNRPVYGLNQLPNFISPFPDGFEYDMEQLKTMTRRYLENTLSVHDRNDHWLIGALQIYLMIDYVDTYYPNMKIIGTLSNWWVIRWAHAADLEFNDQYPLLYLNMARNNLHQKLTTPKDSLLKFNKNIANDYYGGQGLKYLEDYVGKETLQQGLKDYVTSFRLKYSTPQDFQTTIEQHTSLPVNWYFEDYADTRTTIDFKIKKVAKRGDSLDVTLKNLQPNKLPVALYGLNKEDILFKQWTKPFDSTTTVTVPASDVRKLVVNYDGVIPEFNQRNNYKKVKGFLNRPLQFRLFQDVEDPKYNQLFFMPIFEYNFYDGLSLGMKLYNKTVLPKGVHYKLEPQYGLKSNTLVGSGSIAFTDLRDGNQPYAIRYGISGNYYSYDDGLFYKRFTPYMTIAFRNDDIRNNEKQYINLRNINVSRDEDPNDPNQDPDYSVFNFQYVYSNPNLINYFRGVVDYQISSKFSKISAELEYRKLFLNNRQLNVRFFAGTFLFNDSRSNGDFFSFALDRPTDYLFDYNYYGRSENSGLFSQQIIIAEGGFKSQLEPAFANSWMTTINASTNLWKWIYAYGDVGLVHNKDRGTQGVFDTGIRVSLVADYFELFFPLYSNLGWEPGLPNYDQRIRFIVTLSPKTLLGLFTREWY
ncbi:MAG: metalloprotease [Flavobacteriaceae bacterium]|nr:metalloprotease [Flavobacteriaceae bacterium]|tara:strand:+ start:9773 stop:12556 length:2784 start_codon:yes stop_codon:yes gene_type:complete